MSDSQNQARRRQRVTNTLYAAWHEMNLGSLIDELFSEVSADVVRRADGREGVLSSCTGVSIAAALEIGDLVEVRARVIGADVGHHRLALEARSVPRPSDGSEKVVVAAAVGTVVVPNVVEL